MILIETPPSPSCHLTAVNLPPPDTPGPPLLLLPTNPWLLGGRKNNDRGPALPSPLSVKLPWKLRLAGSREQWVPLQSLSPCPPPPSSCQAWHLLLSKPSQNEKAGGAEHPLLLSPDLFPLEEDLCYPESETFLDLAVGGAFRRIRAVAGQGPHYSVPQGEG